MPKLTGDEFLAIMTRANSALFAQARGDADSVAEQWDALIRYVYSLASD